MISQQYNNNKHSNKSLEEMAVCEATYFIIDSVSTHYVDSDVQDNLNNKEWSKVDDSTKNNDNIAQAMQNMEVSESVSIHEMNDEKIIHDKAQKNKIKKHINQEKRIIPPTSSRWLNTFNIAKEVLEPGQTDTPTYSNIAALLYENHTHETYVELLFKIAEKNNSHLQLKEIDGAIQVKTNNGILHVPIDHFHSYLRQENDIWCIVCYISFPEKDAEVHKYEVTHMNHVVKNIDYRGFRKVNYSYSHCVICNLMVKKKKEATAHIKTCCHIETRKLFTKKSKAST